MIRSSFAEFNIAMSALNTARGNVQVTAHNIANSTTDGYSRQYALQKTTKPYASGRSGMWGTGSEVTNVLQHRSAFLDTQYRSKNSVLGQYAIKNQQLSISEVTIGALGETGLTAQIDDLFNTLEDLSVSPESLTTRNNTISSAGSLVEQLSTVGSQLQQQQSSINQEVKSVVDRINAIGNQVASLNDQIRISETNGSRANDLRDQRNLLIDELSSYANIVVTEVEKNKEYDPYDPTSGPSNLQLKIKINGYTFVSGDYVNDLECVARDGKNQINAMDVSGLYDIKFSKSGEEFDIYSSTLSGELKGLIDMRDGNNGISTLSDANGDPMTSNLYKGLPHYMNKINNFIRTLALTFNEGKTFDTSYGYGTSAVKVDLQGIDGHQNSYDLNGDKGQLFFTYLDGSTEVKGNITDYSKINFNNFMVNSSLVDDPRLLACSSNPTSGESNAEAILGLINLKTNTKVFKDGSYQDYLIALTGEMAIGKAQANNFENNYTEVVGLTQNQRLAVMGVDGNEEGVNLTKYQQMYEAAAKLVSVITRMYDTCINLGR